MGGIPYPILEMQYHLTSYHKTDSLSDLGLHEKVV